MAPPGHIPPLAAALRCKLDLPEPPVTEEWGQGSKRNRPLK